MGNKKIDRDQPRKNNRKEQRKTENILEQLKVESLNEQKAPYRNICKLTKSKPQTNKKQQRNTEI
jgi:hypothetical protein